MPSRPTLLELFSGAISGTSTLTPEDLRAQVQVYSGTTHQLTVRIFKVDGAIWRGPVLHDRPVSEIAWSLEGKLATGDAQTQLASPEFEAALRFTTLTCNALAFPIFPRKTQDRRLQRSRDAAVRLREGIFRALLGPRRDAVLSEEEMTASLRENYLAFGSHTDDNLAALSHISIGKAQRNDHTFVTGIKCGNELLSELWRTIQLKKRKAWEAAFTEASEDWPVYQALLFTIFASAEAN